MNRQFGSRLTAALLCVLFLSFAFMQDLNLEESPTVVLNATDLLQNETLIVEGLHLTPEALYTLSLSDPEGNLVATEILMADTQGDIRFTMPLADEGIWQVAIRGEDLRAIFEVDVEAAELSEAAPVDTTETGSESSELTTEDAETVESDTAEVVTDEAVNSTVESADSTIVESEVTESNEEVSTEAESTEVESAEMEGVESGEEATLTAEDATDETQTDTSEASNTVEVEEAESEAQDPLEEPTTEAESVDTDTAPLDTEMTEPAEDTVTEEQETTAEVAEDTTEATQDAVEPLTEASEDITEEITNEETSETETTEDAQVETSEATNVEGESSESSSEASIDTSEELAETPEAETLLDETAEETGTEETGTEETPVEEVVAEETPAEEAINESASEDSAAAEPAEDTASEEPATEESVEAEPSEEVEPSVAAIDTSALISSIASTEDFTELAGIARQLVDAGDLNVAGDAMNKSLSNFAAQGYDPRLVRDLDQHESYNFPLKPLEAAVAAGDLEKAGFWAKWATYFVSPDVPAVGDALRDYASLIRKEEGRVAARPWRDAANLGRRTNLASVLDTFFANLGRTGWYGVLALVAAVVALHITLLFKYWAPQTLFINRRKAAGRSAGVLPRLFVMRYHSTFEKLVLVLMLASALLLAGLANWTKESENILSVTDGNFASENVQAALSSAELSGAKGSFIKAYAAHLAGDTATAEAEYQAAGDLPAALNNLAALNNDPELFAKALSVSPNFPEAKYNTEENSELFPFQKTFLTGQSVLAVPTQEDIQAATVGSWQDAVVRTFSNPWTAFASMDPWSNVLNAQAPWFSVYLWYAALGLIFLWMAIKVLWLFFPRPRLARNAPRNPLYQLFAFLIPGSGAADEMWGLLLLIPWAIVGLDTLADIFNWGFGIGLTRQWDYIVLGIIYVINLVAVIIEYLSYSRRMQALKRDKPELASEFGMKT